jgi:sigma-54 dependent transcriptional regulator, acetoin dehydrogenase operon transcriptional activator AcoR
MLEHHWPHNVRGLEQRLRTAVVLAVDGRIELSHFSGDRRLAEPASGSSPPPLAPRTLSPEDAALHAELVAQLSDHRGNVTRVGAAMGKSRTQIQRWVRRFGIDTERFRR